MLQRPHQLRQPSGASGPSTMRCRSWGVWCLHGRGKVALRVCALYCRGIGAVRCRHASVLVFRARQLRLPALRSSRALPACRPSPYALQQVHKGGAPQLWGQHQSRDAHPVQRVAQLCSRESRGGRSTWSRPLEAQQQIQAGAHAAGWCRRGWQAAASRPGAQGTLQGVAAGGPPECMAGQSGRAAYASLILATDTTRVLVQPASCKGGAALPHWPGPPAALSEGFRLTSTAPACRAAGNAACQRTQQGGFRQAPAPPHAVGVRLPLQAPSSPPAPLTRAAAYCSTAHSTLLGAQMPTRSLRCSSRGDAGGMGRCVAARRGSLVLQAPLGAAPSQGTCTPGIPKRSSTCAASPCSARPQLLAGLPFPQPLPAPPAPAGLAPRRLPGAAALRR